MRERPINSFGLALADQGHPRAALDANDVRIRPLRAQHPVQSYRQLARRCHLSHRFRRPALFYFDGSDKSTFEHLTFTDPTSASRNSAVSTKERQNRERAGPQCEITS